MSTKSVIVLDDSSDEDEEEMAPATDRRNVPLSVSSSSDESDARPSQAKKPRVASSTPDAPATSSSNPTAPKGLNSSSSSTGELESTDELEDSDDQEKIATPQPPPAKTVKKTIATGPSSVEQSDASADSGEDNLDDATTLRFARRDGRMYSDALSFSELQAQQRELERLQAHRKNIVHSPRKTKTGARNTTLSGTKRKAGASVSSGHSNPHSTSKRPVMKKTTSPSPFDFNFPGSSDDASSSGSDEHGTPTISGRAKPMSLRDVVAQERKLARQRKTTTEKSNGSSSSKKVTQKKQKPKPLFWFGAPKQENIIDGTEWSASEPDEDDNDDDDDDDAEENQQQFINEPELLSEASSLESDDKPSSDEEYKPSESKHLVKPLEQNASRSANADKKKNGTPSKPSKKKSRTKKSGKTSTKTRPSSAKAEVHAGTPAQTKTVTDKLAKPRDATDTVMPSTVWRNVSIDVAPPNLLPVASAVALPFLSQCDRPLMTYDEDGDLRSKCKLITHFGKSTQFVSSALVSDDQRITQEDMDNRVTEIITKELPRIQACHKRKTFAIIAEERAKVHAYRAAHDSLHPSKIPKLRSSRLSEVSTLDKSLLNQMKQERLSQRLSLGYKNVWGEEIPVEERLFPVDVNQLPAIRPLSRSTAFIGLKTNVRVEDDPILRYMPYFGDNDDGGDIDVAWYDAIKSDDSNPPSGLDGEVNEYLLRLVIRECGASDLVFNALKKVPGFAQAYSDYSDIKKLDESMRLAARRIKEARDLIANKPADFPLSKVATLEPLLNDQKNSEKALTTRFAPPPTYFDSNLARCHKNRGYGLGLRPTEDYTELMVTYRDMFCRMCYVYHCLEHGIEHPLPSHRVDPINPPLHLSAVALRAKAREEERQDDATPSDQTPESNTPESNSPAVSPPAGSIAPDSTTSISGDNKQITDSLNHNEDAHIDEDIVMEIVSSETLYETATDEDASATVELHETRRSRRSATRMSSLASQSLKHQASKPSRRKPSRTIRVNTYPKVPDESEYLDDSHHAWVKSAVKKSLNANEPCSGICCNVNILRGLHKKIGVAYSTTHGWGAFALEPIKRGEFIYEYHGALLSQDEAERRGSIYDKMTISFLFDADDDSVVDAIRKGNKSKFANHSAVGQKCKGKVLTVGGEHRISIWAQQDIEKGEELFFDYGYHGETAPDWSQLRIKGAVRQKAAKTKKEEH
ncbi:Histone-lysine N-methyltransferase ezh1 [Phytophthora boehmeriae]|uniref:Histone-lysine N-methyltransferase ezh1 n=1 Tax=Phytophthora boehmeriae TaxID=109152 RepID=A0A8T1XDW2_9STRA|nr:Histone-lysine N-methyltransferase ezh1 [Phytophthora boehmeriae]